MRAGGVPAPGESLGLFMLVSCGAKAVTSAKKKKQEKKKKNGNRTYRRVGSLHRDAQGEEEQRHGELSQALQVFIHLGGNKSRVRLR